MNKSENLKDKLEQEGWTFLTNAIIADEDIMKGLPGFPLDKPTSWELVKSYQESFKEVRLEQAYDKSGNPLPANKIKAVYVKK